MEQPEPVAATDHRVIIGGFGVPGRAVAELLSQRGVDYCIVERNPSTVSRCTITGVPIIAGDVAEEATLCEAGIASATMLILTVPDDTVAVVATALAKRLNPAVRVITRCHYISAGLKARQQGAEAVIVAEQVVATELSHLLNDLLMPDDAPRE